MILWPGMGLMVMRKLVFGIFLGLACCAATLGMARADDKAADLKATIDKRLESFDPAAVAAARHYYTSPIMMGSFKAMVPQIVKALDVSIAQTNVSLDPAAKQEALSVAQTAVASKLDLIVGLAMVNALEVFSKDELVAIDQFYSSPAGQSVMSKMPQVMSKLPAMMQLVMPLMLADVREQMKAKGKDLK
jgi:hypothetical protein